MQCLFIRDQCSSHFLIHVLCCSCRKSNHHAHDETKDDDETEGGRKHNNPDSSKSLILGTQYSILNDSSALDSLVAWRGVLWEDSKWDNDTVGKKSTKTTNIETFAEIEHQTWIFLNCREDTCADVGNRHDQTCWKAQLCHDEVLRKRVNELTFFIISSAFHSWFLKLLHHDAWVNTIEDHGKGVDEWE